MSQPFIGEIRMFAFGTGGAPNSWQACDGRLLPISEYAAQFSLIGPTHGGAGQTPVPRPHLAAPAPSAISGHHHFAASVVDAVLDRLGREAAEDH